MTTLVRLYLRAAAGRRRTLVLVLVAFAPVLAAAGEALTHAAVFPGEFTSALVERVFLPSVAAFVTIVIASSVLGDERDDGTILYLAATPIPRFTLTAAAFVAAWFLASVILVPSVVLCVVLPGAESVTGVVWVAAATILVAAAYAAVFVALSLVSRRPVIIGVLYVLLWEGTIAGFAASAARLSISAYARVVAAQGLGADAYNYNVPNVAAASAVAVLVVVVGAGLFAASRALRRAELP